MSTASGNSSSTSVNRGTEIAVSNAITTLFETIEDNFLALARVCLRLFLKENIEQPHKPSLAPPEENLKSKDWRSIFAVKPGRKTSGSSDRNGF